MSRAVDFYGTAAGTKLASFATTRRSSDTETRVSALEALASSLWLRKKAPQRFTWSGSAGRRGKLSEDRALDQFKIAADDPDTPERERALSNLRAGEILDTMGRRGEAVNYHRRVQQLQEFDGSHEIAEQYLLSPYHPE